MYLLPDLGHFAWIWAIIHGFGPFGSDLGHVVWIRANWQNLGQNRPQKDGRTESPCVLQDFIPLEVAALLPPISIHSHAKQGNGYR